MTEMGISPTEKVVEWDMGMSENGVYPNYSHLVGIMIINHWV